MNGKTMIPVTSIQRFCMHDGPGVRTTVFLKGCPLSCKWCHNPEARECKSIILYDEKKCIGCMSCYVCPCGAHEFIAGQKHVYFREKCIVCGKCSTVCPVSALEKDHKMMSVSEIISIVLRDKDFYGENGGVTLSGGEPMMHGEKTAELIYELKKAGLNVSVETSGCFDKKLLDKVSPYTDLFLWDIKDSDPNRLFENTGAELSNILENLKYADSLGVPSILRCLMIEGINFTSSHIEFIKRLKCSLLNSKGVDLLSYHPMGDSKCRISGVDASFHDRKYIPSDEKMERARFFLDSEDTICVLNEE